MAAASATERAYGYNSIYDGNGMDASYGYQMPDNYYGGDLAYAPYHVSRRGRRSPSPQQGDFTRLLNEFKRIELEFFGGLKGLFFPRG